MAKTLKTKYITAEEFLEYTGINLSEELKDNGNPSNKVNAFLYRVEKRMSFYIFANFYRKVNYEYERFNDFQKECYKTALIEQALYVFKNGDISVDSGYDPEKGIIINQAQKRQIEICDNAREQLIAGGLWCRKIRVRGWIGSDWWMY